MAIRRDRKGKFAQNFSGKDAPSTPVIPGRVTTPSAAAPASSAQADYRSMYSSWVSSQPSAASAPNRGPSRGYVAPLPRYRGISDMVASFDMRATAN